MTSTTSRDRVRVGEDDPATRLGLTEFVRTLGVRHRGRSRREERSSVSSPSGLHHHQRPRHAARGRS